MPISLLQQHQLIGTCDFTQYSNAQRNSLSQSELRSPRFRLDFDFLRSVIEHANPDMIEQEILLDLSHDLVQHLLRILAGDSGLRDAVEEAQVARAPLLFLKESCVLDSNRNLACRSLEQFNVSFAINLLVGVVEGGHDAHRLALHENRHTTERLRRTARNKRRSNPLPYLFHVTADQ